MTINNRIELVIKELGLNKNSFSVAIGVNPTIIHNIIKGRNAPGFDVLSKIALSFDKIDMNWLISGRGNILKLAEVCDPASEGISDNVFVGILERKDIRIEKLIEENAGLRNQIDIIKLSGKRDD